MNIPADEELFAALAARRVTPGAEPVALAVAEALARRASAAEGETRRLLLARLQRRIDAISSAATAAPAAASAPAPWAALTSLVDRLGRAEAPPPRSQVRAPAPPPLKTVAALQPTVGRLKAEHRLRQARAQVPENAGPLHSSRVVHRMLQTLHADAPGYLQALSASVEALAELEREFEASLRPAGREARGERRRQR
ncbi:DUF2894 domain-containing protein [Rubrivivax gelatinosus]|uniref:DUF2894 family protein n=1 Tax=Rubrivivax gelatinosus TaxID=28068 RepID=A0A4R2MI39_RUBGE|nr:DUF2894 domain-containing protein [Rubrivivax gelatinosus]MBK1688706.1 hypothetical protein [Rubrivivax gelatinosus]TCP04577.1 DUF2894 family protein [Rubrivivax gelatinosus]